MCSWYVRAPTRAEMISTVKRITACFQYVMSHLRAREKYALVHFTLYDCLSQGSSHGGRLQGQSAAGRIRPRAETKQGTAYVISSSFIHSFIRLPSISLR